MDINITIDMGEYNVIGKKLYGGAFGACSISGAYMVRSFVATAPSLEVFLDGIEKNLYEAYPLSDGWTDHWKAYQEATPRQISEAVAGLLLPNENENE